ncbi:hypothetical protein ASG42_27140 [Rhizobium sp. Leaf391]|uniref:hypothetical protein n=1 Tax=Rhizobium sp. Leaf391 TaxID=1736360 RepID=UPI0007159177|nr:hypothetical protein [Rhizobium sp. Leaf391]KQT01683.1 hypothetical protein ASG42_27140 [Rhizobium sp. Leaf391]
MRTDLETLGDFIGQQLIRNKLTTNTANSYASSVSRVFSIATDAEKANVLGVNIEDLYVRFRAANDGLANKTAESYEGRVSAILNQFAEFVAKEGAGGGSTIMGTLAIPLRTGVVKVDGIPSDLTVAEATRIAAMITAMAS